MAERLPPLIAVRYFEVAARQLSFTKAAQELHAAETEAPPTDSATIASFSARVQRRRASATTTNRCSSPPGPDIGTA
jgi:hypothetical protein